MSRHDDPKWKREVLEEASRRYWEITRDATKSGATEQRIVEAAVEEVMYRYKTAEEQTTAMFIWAFVALTISSHVLNEVSQQQGSQSLYDAFVQKTIEDMESRFGF